MGSRECLLELGAGMIRGVEGRKVRGERCDHLEIGRRKAVAGDLLQGLG